MWVLVNGGPLHDGFEKTADPVSHERTTTPRNNEYE